MLQAFSCYLSFDYDAASINDIDNSYLIINYSDNEIDADNFSLNLKNGVTLIGKLVADNEKTKLSAYSFMTLTETKERKFPMIVYIIITFALLFAIFAIRAILIKVLENTRGIKYSELKAAERKNKKDKKKKGFSFKEEASVFTDFIDFGKNKKNKDTNINEEVVPTEENEIEQPENEVEDSTEEEETKKDVK